MEKSNLDRIMDVLFTDDLGSEEKYEGEMSLHKSAQEEGTNWLGFKFGPIGQVHDFEMSLENITRIRKYEAIYQECKAALETPSPAPSTQQDSQPEKYSINATQVASCMPQDVANATPIPAIPLVEHGNSAAIVNNTEMDATPPNLLLKQDSVTLTTTKFAISATLPTPCRQEDFVATPTLVIIPSVKQGNPSRKTNDTEMNATPPNPLLQQDYVTPPTAKCAINATLATPCMQEALAKAKSCVGDDATPTPTLANSHLAKQGNPSGIAINTKIDATPPNPLLQQESTITNLVLDAAPSIKYHGMNEIIAMNNGEDGMVVKQGIKKANVQAHGARKKNRVKLPAPWLDNYSVENKPRASSKVIDTYYHHQILNFRCRSRVEVALYELHGITPNHARDESNLEFLADAANFIKEFEKQNSEKNSSSTKRKRKKTASENLEGTNSAPTMNLDEKNSTVLEGGNEDEGMEAKVNLKEEGAVKMQQEGEGSQEGGIMASQTPNSESAFKFDDSGFIDVPVLYCAEEIKNLLSSNQGAMTSAASQHETVMPGYKEHIGNDCQTSWKSSELDELNATKLALETMEAQFNATKQALTIMEARLDSMIEMERQNRRLLQALNNGTKNPTPSK